MTTKIKIAITSLITLILAVACPFNVSAVSNEIGTYKNSFFVDTLKTQNNQSNIIDQQIGNWGFITSPYKYGLRINTRGGTGTDGKVVYSEGDIIDMSYVLVTTDVLVTADTTKPSAPTCLVSSWIFTIVDCTIHIQAVQDFETWIKDANITGTTTGQWGSTGNLTEQIRWYWNSLNTDSTTKAVNIYYFQYRLRYTGQGEERDNIQLYGNFTNGQPWALQFNNTLTISSSLEQGAIQAQQNEQNAGQTAQQDGQTGGDASGTQASQGTQSLLSAITGFVGVISNATPTNCRITGDMGALDLGELDFCQDNPPAIITTIGTLILIGITIPITIWVIKKIISMFRSFTNG